MRGISHGQLGPDGETLHVGLSRPPWALKTDGGGYIRWRKWRKVVVEKKAKRASRMSREGLSLKRVKNKMILGMLNIERVEAGRTRSSLSEE